MKWMSAVLVLVSAFFAVVGAAPFGGGAFFPAFSLPLAAWLTWRGAVWGPLLVVAIAVFGFWASVFPLETIFDGWPFPTWLALWSGVILAGLIRKGSNTGTPNPP